MRAILQVAMIAAVAVAFSGPASASPGCDLRDTVLAKFATRHSEAPIVQALAFGGGMIEVLATADGSTWTMVMSFPNGQTCILGAGTDWQPLTPVIAGNPT